MSEIKPALTPEEWAAVRAAGGPVQYDGIFEDRVEEPEAYHYIAAMGNEALPDGDPRKLTWADVHRLRELEYMNLDRHVDGPPLASIADRIAALLPPENPPASP